MDSHLLLWRHAEASLGIEDINRDLTDKGKLDGKKIAELLAKNYTNMSLFCSNAIRTINTSNYLVNILPKIKTYYFDKLYLATSDEMIISSIKIQLIKKIYYVLVITQGFIN